jgi:hypothetical protein
MKNRIHLRPGFAGLALALTIIAGTGVSAFANEGHNKEKEKAPAQDHAGMNMSADSAAAIAAYPIATCVVSGDKLEDGDMGPVINYVHKEAGKPDRLVRLCCKGCIKKFNKEPAKYLKLIDDAAAAKAKGEKPAGSDGHDGHAH